MLLMPAHSLPDPDVVRLYLATTRLVTQLSLVHPEHSAELRLELVREHGEYTMGRTSDERFRRLVASIAERCLADRAARSSPPA